MYLFELWFLGLQQCFLCRQHWEEGMLYIHVAVTVLCLFCWAISVTVPEGWGDWSVGDCWTGIFIPVIQILFLTSCHCTEEKNIYFTTLIITLTSLRCVASVQLLGVWVCTKPKISLDSVFKTELSKSLTSVWTVFWQKLHAVRSSN